MTPDQSTESSLTRILERQKGYPGGDTVHEIVRRWAEATPNQNAIQTLGRKPLTYRLLYDQIEYVRKTLNEMGVGRNDVVAIVLPNSPGLAVTFMGVASAATSAPLNPNYTESELQFYLSDMQAKAIIVLKGLESPAVKVAREENIKIIELESQHWEPAGVFKLEGEKAEKAENGGLAEPGDVALILHTSGTTSRPKLVPLTHLNVCACSHSIKRVLQLNSADICLNVMPLFHIHSLTGTSLPSFLAGASVVYTPFFDVAMFYKWMDIFKPTWYTGSPSIHQSLLAYSDDHKAILEGNNLRFIRSAAAPLPPTVLINLEKRFNAPVVEYYGMTEASPLIASNPLPPGKRKIGSVGLPIDLDLAIMDAGKLLPTGKIGEIVIKGDNITSGYGHESDNDNAFVDGWFRTGDQGYVDEDGYVFIIGRLKEIINRGGEKISPRQIDERLLEHPEIIEAVAFAVANRLLGEEVAAAVVLKEGSTLKEWEIQQFVGEKLAYFKIPKFILILDELPKGPTGKIQRIGMAERLAVMMGAKDRDDKTPDEYLKDVLARTLSDIPLYTYAGDLDEVSERASRNRGISLILGEVTTKLPRVTSYTLNTPVMEKMSEIYTDKMHFNKSTAIIGLQTRGSRLPIFLVHNDLGVMDYALNITSRLDISQPVYGFNAKGLEELDQPFDRIDAMAANYLAELKNVQPSGPYILGGAGIGGLIALEMAQQLIWQGEEVELLMLFGTLPVRMHNLGLMKTIRFKMSHLFSRKAWSNALKHLSSESMDIYHKMQERVSNYNRVAAKKYKQETYPCDVLLFVSEESDDNPGGCQALIDEWSRLISGRLYSKVLPGSSDQLLEESNVETITQVLKEHIYSK